MQQSTQTDDLVQMFLRIHSIDRVPRSGFLLRGITEPESVAAHAHARALLCSAVCRISPGEFDQEKALTMALIHDLPEVVTMDIPMPAGNEAFNQAKDQTEAQIAQRLLDAVPEFYDLYLEYVNLGSSEARLVKGLYKVQMMIKVLAYEREGRGLLTDFWANPANFLSYGIELVERLFASILSLAGRQRPESSDR